MSRRAAAGAGAAVDKAASSAGGEVKNSEFCPGPIEAGRMTRLMLYSLPTAGQDKQKMLLEQDVGHFSMIRCVTPGWWLVVGCAVRGTGTKRLWDKGLRNLG